MTQTNRLDRVCHSRCARVLAEYKLPRAIKSWRVRRLIAFRILVLARFTTPKPKPICFSSLGVSCRLLGREDASIIRSILASRPPELTYGIDRISLGLSTKDPKARPL